MNELREQDELIEAVCQVRCDIPGVRWDDGLTEGVARIERMKAERIISTVQSHAGAALSVITKAHRQDLIDIINANSWHKSHDIAERALTRIGEIK